MEQLHDALQDGLLHDPPVKPRQLRIRVTAGLVPKEGKIEVVTQDGEVLGELGNSTSECVWRMGVQDGLATLVLTLAAEHAEIEGMASP